MYHTPKAHSDLTPVHPAPYSRPDPLYIFCSHHFRLFQLELYIVCPILRDFDVVDFFLPGQYKTERGWPMYDSKRRSY